MITELDVSALPSAWGVTAEITARHDYDEKYNPWKNGVLPKDVECVDEASGGEGAAAFVRGCGADVTLLDVRMPGVDGIAALDEILSDNPDAKVIMLPTSDAEEDIFRAVTMGAKGYLLKESDPNRLLEAIRAVAAGGTCLPVELRRVYEARASERGLTQREVEILQYIAKGYSNEEIAAMAGLSLNTVKTHVKSILANLNVSDRAEAVAKYKGGACVITGGSDVIVPVKYGRRFHGVLVGSSFHLLPEEDHNFSRSYKSSIAIGADYLVRVLSVSPSRLCP